jgi:hypothetical protein
MKKTALSKVSKNNYGYLDVSPGTDMAGRLIGISHSTIKRYLKKGWLKKVGSGLILTKSGYPFEKKEMAKTLHPSGSP